MQIAETIAAIRRNRQPFAFGVEGVHTLSHVENEVDVRIKPLGTNIVDSLTHSSWLLPKRVRLNINMEQDMTNKLAIQLIVGNHEVVASYYGQAQMADHELPTIRFLGLVRNGVAHGNVVTSPDSDPRPGTIWRGFEFTESIEEDTLFR